MKLEEYTSYDAIGLAELVRQREVSPRELAATALAAIEKADPQLNSVVEIYHDRIEDLDEASLGEGPFRGVPFLIKDMFGHEQGRKIEFGSRLCKDMVVETGTYVAENFRASGLNILGRSHAPEYSMAATTETVLYGNCSNPWRAGYSAGGSSGGAQAAVTAGLVPMAHGSDIGGSIRIPASLCGGVGLKPSRGRVSMGPVVDEAGFGYSSNLVQAKTVRDAAVALDCVSVPMPGDPFVIPRPDQPYAEVSRQDSGRLRIGIVLDQLTGVEIDPEIMAAVQQVGRVLEGMGHHVEMGHADMGGPEILAATTDMFFFGFDDRLEGYAERSGRQIGPELLEPTILSLYEYAKTITAKQFLKSWSDLNIARRSLGAFWRDYDIWLSPTTSRVAEPWGNYHLSKPGVTAANVAEQLYRVPIQFTIPHNIMGTPAISLPLAMHSSGLPIGVQLAAAPAREELVLQLSVALERELPWSDRVPEIHVNSQT
ncbi:MAG: amidase [Hyphomicrobiaceae bacterium]